MRKKQERYVNDIFIKNEAKYKPKHDIKVVRVVGKRFKKLNRYKILAIHILKGIGWSNSMIAQALDISLTALLAKLNEEMTPYEKKEMEEDISAYWGDKPHTQRKRMSDLEEEGLL